MVLIYSQQILKLNEQRRNVLFLYLFFGCTGAKAGNGYGRSVTQWRAK